MSKVGYMVLGFVVLTILGGYLYFRGPGPAGWPDAVIVGCFVLLALSFARPSKFDEIVKGAAGYVMRGGKSDQA